MIKSINKYLALVVGVKQQRWRKAVLYQSMKQFGVIFISLLFFLLIGCNQQKKEYYKKVFCGDQYSKAWLFYFYNNKNKFIKSNRGEIYYCDGSSKYFYIENDTLFFYFKPSMIQGTWQIKNDSTIVFGGWAEYQIVSVSDSEIRLDRIHTSDFKDDVYYKPLENFKNYIVDSSRINDTDSLGL